MGKRIGVRGDGVNFNGYWVSFESDENVLELGNGDGCTYIFANILKTPVLFKKE